MTGTAALQTGLLVNLLLIFFAGVLTAVHEFAAAKREDINRKVRFDLERTLQNGGFAIYVASGSAFFGSIPVAKVDFGDHALFGVVWLFMFLALITIELAKARIVDGDSDGWTLSRKLAYPMGIAFVWWVWRGAGGLT